MRTDFDTLFYFYLHIYNAVHPDRIHNFTNDPDKKYKISFIDNYVQFSLKAQLRIHNVLSVNIYM